MTTSTDSAAAKPRPFVPMSPMNLALVWAAFRAIPEDRQEEALEGLRKMAAGLCVFSGPGIYRLRESQKSERTALYHVDEVIDHPSGPFIMCRLADLEAPLPITLRGPFEAWAIERIYTEGAAP